jgi:4-hydroxy 2-oxovalerate aldolase
MNIIDCTLRDGGYYNSWDYDLDLVNNYLQACNASGITNVELGFRSLSSKEFKGPTYYTTDKFIQDHVIKPDAIKIGVMINASEFIFDGCAAIDTLLACFKKAELSPVSFVRIASHAREMDQSIALFKELYQLGYSVIINIMQFNEQHDDTKKDVIKLLTTKCAGRLDALYFADSVGSMTPKDITSTVSIIRSFGWTGDLGFHAHDNMSFALINAIQSLNDGVNWLDCTVAGMGRGAGNLSTEMLLAYCLSDDRSEYDFTPIMKLSAQSFSELKASYGWGASPLYLLAAKWRIHPTYVQQLEAGNSQSFEALAVLEELKKHDALKYDKNLLESIVGSLKNSENRGANALPDQAVAIYPGKTLLLIGPNESASKNRKPLLKLIQNPNIIAFCVNINSSFIDDIDNYITANENQIIYDSFQYSREPVCLVAPPALLESGKISKVKCTTVPYGLTVQKDSCVSNQFGCTIPSTSSLAYALAFSISSKFKNTLIVGFDGFEGRGHSHNVNQYVIDHICQDQPENPIFSLTDTHYSVEILSLFDPALEELVAHG